MTESQIQALETAKHEREAHGEVESPHPGFLVGQDTCYIGTIKGVGRIYQQTALDTHANVGFARVYTEKTAITASDLMNDRILPFYDEHGIRVLRALTDNGQELCGRVETHPYELLLHLNDIEHTRTRVGRPQTNGSVERLNQIIQDEFYAVAFRRRLYLVPSRKSNSIWTPSWKSTTAYAPTRGATAKGERRFKPLSTGWSCIRGTFMKMSWRNQKRPSIL